MTSTVDREPVEQQHGRSDRLVVVGASAGGVEALRTLVASLPADFPAPVLAVLHLPQAARTVLPQILDRASALTVREAREGDRLEPGVVLIAPPGRHLICHGGRVTLSAGPRENGHRPAIDVLFRSAARSHGRGLVAVVLTGALDDGTAGLVAVHARGGVGVVQDPEEALYPSMPRSALQRAHPEHVRPLAGMAPLLQELVTADLPDAPGAAVSDLMEAEVATSDRTPVDVHAPEPLGPAAGLACPDCNGTLFWVEEGDLLRYRCRVGHAWSPESLVARQSSATETALWTALRTLEEKASLTHDLGERAGDQGHHRAQGVYADQSTDALRAAALVRRLLERVAEGTLDLDLPAPGPGSGPGPVHEET
jgi:two-component system chemotaxis response regulator CheB